MTVSVEVEKAIARVKSLSDAKSIAVMRENVIGNANISDEQRATLLKEIDLKLRIISPKVASSILGPKDAAAEKFLESVLKQMESDYDLSGNILAKNNVKVGGNQMDGTQYVNRYVAYKNADNMSLGISWDQDDSNSEPYLRVTLRKVDGAGSPAIIDKIFTSEASAMKFYLNELSSLVAN